MSKIRGTSWLILNEDLWKKLTDSRRTEIRTWLRMNGINPGIVPVDSDVLITEVSDGEWEIWFEEFQTNAVGDIVIDPDGTGEVCVFERATPMVIDPPVTWLIPIPT